MGPRVTRLWVRTPWLRRFASTKGSSDHEVELARLWLKTLDSKTVPRQIGELSFSRSSGPGGQNVNKVNTKATLKVPLAALLPLVPRLLHPKLHTSRYASDRSQALIFQSDESRKQASNVDSCFDKLHQLLESAAKAVIPGETSPEQKDRVQKLQRAQNESRLKSKKFQSDKKSNRRGNKYDD
ncbi:hypothetical protein N7513_007964 [Penicillium frequentans]|uniref:Prokaryotic-type class I peptide chain release factors domain-containing protein n=1 Tax=Penicillium frequentans TaxID=3151616 RepID=A0AAD6CVW1_9EURO|nr:hypothetical protein N7513_007964 [Penicillium glabrum]KAJ5541092.1 hypothetical protein N7494_006168 [Penicillium glabrum]